MICPEPKQELAKKRLKNYLLSTEFTHLITLTSFSGVDTKYLHNLIGATKPIPEINDNKKLIDWNTDETEIILEKIFQELTRQEDYFKEWCRIDLAKNELNFFIKLVIEVLMLVILPRLKNPDDKVKLKIKELVSILRNLNEVYVLTVLPITLITQPESYNKITQLLRKGLFSTKSNEINHALDPRTRTTVE